MIANHFHGLVSFSGFEVNEDHRIPGHVFVALRLGPFVLGLGRRGKPGHRKEERNPQGCNQKTSRGGSVGASELGHSGERALGKGNREVGAGTDTSLR